MKTKIIKKKVAKTIMKTEEQKTPKDSNTGK
jgi:hypothetical protein